MQSAIERYDADLAALNRFHPLPYAPTRHERLKRFYSNWLENLTALDFDALSSDARIDYVLLKNQLDYELRYLDRMKRDYSEMEALMPFAAIVFDLTETELRMKPVDPAETAKQVDRLASEIEETQKAFDAELESEGTILGIKKTLANRAVRTLDDILCALHHWFDYHNGYDPMFTWWVEAPYQQAEKALQDYITFIQEQIVGVEQEDNDSIVGDPIGRKALLSELAYEMIPYTPEDLIDIANSEFEWCDAEMLRASQDLGFGSDWQKALEHVKTLHVAPGKQPQLIHDLAFEAIDFLEARNLLTIPPLAKHIWRMEMMSPEMQKVNPYFTGGEVISISFPTNTMPHEQKLMSLRSNNIHFSRATVHHELIPGHHLQGFMTKRFRPYRRLFRTPFWIEGWALYWEMLLWDLNFQQSPENRIGMLFWRRHRCARIIFSLRFHLEEMTAQECVDFLVERVGHERDSATAEVRRSVSGAYGPLYQCAYMLGGLQFRALHRELVQTGKMTNREFHDEILKENSIPVEMVRAILTKQNLTRNFTPSWKFYDKD